MGFSNRDKPKTLPLLSSESGQGIVEYILVLVVTIGLVLGGVYQLNTAFKKWANNYFGNYLACLLETGELPSVGGGPGANASSCQSLYEEFSLANGRPSKLSGDSGSGGSGGAGGSGATGSGGGSNETQRHGANGSSGQYSQIRGFGKGSDGRGGAPARNKMKDGEQSRNTGDTSAKGYGNAYSATNRKMNTGVKHRLDNGFAFQNDEGDKLRRKVASGGKPTKEAEGRKPRMALNNKIFKKSELPEDSNEISFGGFLRFIIIAAIIIALVMFLGGQALQIGKSMD